MNDALASFAYTLGRRDALGHVPQSLNPYPEGSGEAEQWRQGYQSAIEAPCLMPDHKCPLAVGECDLFCYIRDCERGNDGSEYGPGDPDYDRERRLDRAA